MIYRAKYIQVREIEAGIVELQFRSPNSVNILNVKTLKTISKALNIIKHFTNLKGVLITSSKSSFIVGADINEFLYLFNYPTIELEAWMNHIKTLFLQIEMIPVPTVCVISGYALGGGCELALTSDYRIADNTTQIGFPETTLGIIPGFDGCIRLPRLIGIEKALPIIVNGISLPAQSALECGLLDEVVEQEHLQLAAMTQLHKAINNPDEWQQRRQIKQNPIKQDSFDDHLFDQTLNRLKQTLNSNYLAPYTALELLKKSWSHPRNSASSMETKCFIDLSQTTQTTALISNYLNEQYVKSHAKKALKSESSPDHIAVIGAGTLGGGIAIHAATHGIQVQLKATNQTSIHSGMSYIDTLLKQGVNTKKINPKQYTQIRNNISPSTNGRSLDKAELVIEALAESLPKKIQFIREIEIHSVSGSILTTHTSTIQIDELARYLKHPELFCGLHFFQPVHKIPVVEVIKGKQTSEATISKVVSFVAKMGKLPIVVNDSPGFFTTRVYAAYLSALLQLIDERIDIQRIDRVMTTFGWVIGPVAQVDAIGIDMVMVILDRIHPSFSSRISDSRHLLLEQLYEKQQLGCKTHEGFYNYQQEPRQVSSNVVTYYSSEKNSEINDEDIIQRLMFALCNETIHCLDEGVIASPEEADIMLIYALGFPRYLGGVFRYIDSMGLEDYINKISQYKKLGEIYNTPKGLLTRIDRHKSFYHHPDIENELIL
jgi:3-hydroxyacyl-CoA dehydrogenase / enoyl-CoA hydratase / 3-hydroxybutyryl-CoA epimerase / enoyl-CoA isomerase